MNTDKIRKCGKHNTTLSLEGECGNCETEMWDSLQDAFGEKLKCPYDQNEVESSDADDGYWDFACINIKCRKEFRIMCCSDCGVPNCSCYDNAIMDEHHLEQAGGLDEVQRQKRLRYYGEE